MTVIVAPQGDITVAQWVAFWGDLHGNLSAPGFAWDAFMSHSMTFYAPELSPFLARWQARCAALDLFPFFCHRVIPPFPPSLPGRERTPSAGGGGGVSLERTRGRRNNSSVCDTCHAPRARSFPPPQKKRVPFLGRRALNPLDGVTLYSAFIAVPSSGLIVEVGGRSVGRSRRHWRASLPPLWWSSPTPRSCHAHVSRASRAARGGGMTSSWWS